MSRLSRADAAKSVIAVWRWLHEQPDAPNIVGNATELLARLPAEVGNVPHDSTTGISERLRLMEQLKLVRRDAHHEVLETDSDKRAWPKYVATTVLLEDDVEKGARVIAQHFARGGFLKINSKGNKKLRGDERPVDPDRVAIRTDEKERPVEAVVGEDAPTLGEAMKATFAEVTRAVAPPKDEPAAFVAAARQYERRNDFVIEKLREIEALGIEIDREKVLKGVHLQRDDELEGVVRVLPYIDELEAHGKQAQAWRDEIVSLRNELREVRKERDAARAEAAQQKEANRRLANKMARDAVTRGSQPQVLVG